MSHEWTNVWSVILLFLYSSNSWENYWMSLQQLVLFSDNTEVGINSMLPIVSFWPISQHRSLLTLYDQIAWGLTRRNHQEMSTGTSFKVIFEVTFRFSNRLPKLVTNWNACLPISTSVLLITARKRSSRRLCFHTYLSFSPRKFELDQCDIWDQSSTEEVCSKLYFVECFYWQRIMSTLYSILLILTRIHSSSMRTVSSLPNRETPLQWSPWTVGRPPVDRQTPVKILPCPKLRLRAVKMAINMFTKNKTSYVILEIFSQDFSAGVVCSLGWP